MSYKRRSSLLRLSWGDHVIVRLVMLAEENDGGEGYPWKFRYRMYILPRAQVTSFLLACIIYCYIECR